MIELLDDESFEKLSESRDCVIAMTPVWSQYPKELIVTILNIERELDVPIFNVSEDEPEKNPRFNTWIVENGGISKLPGIATGAGSMVFIKNGRLFGIESCCWRKTEGEFLRLIRSIYEE